MTGQPGSFEQLARMVGEALAPLAQRLAATDVEQLFLELGLRLPPGAFAQGGLPAALQATVNGAAALPPKLADLAAAIQADDSVAIAAAGLSLAGTIAPIVQGISQISSALDGVAAGLPGLDAGQRARVQQFAAELPERLITFLLLEWLDDLAPALAPSLALAGLVDRIALPGDPADLTTPPFVRRALRLDRIGPMLSDPVGYLQMLYGFGRPDFDGIELFTRIKALVDRPNAEARIITAPGMPAILEAFFIRLAVEKPPGELPGLSLRLRTAAIADVVLDEPLMGPWKLIATTTSRFDAGLEANIRPPGAISFLPPVGNAKVSLAFGVEASRGGEEMVLLGQAGASRITLQKLTGKLGLEATATTAAPSPASIPTITVALDGARVVIDTSGGDSFLSLLTGGAKGDAAVSLSGTWTPDHGLKIDGSAAIEIAIPAHAGIGPVELETIYLISGLAPGGAVPVEVSAAIKGSLGPLVVTVDRIGLGAELTFPGQGGNFGPVDLDIGFKPPIGIGMVLDGGGFKGGGFLYLDVPKGEYAGALELSFQGIVDVRAIGILNTKLPDGQPGFSLLILISAEFTPIQLSFGFTLVGVGGLIGLNRTILIDPLRAGVRDGSLNSVLFPRDVVANAPRIIGDLKRIFPPLDGRFLIGPMAKLGWGTPTIVSLELGLLLEIPRPGFALAGVLRITLPVEDAAIIKIQVNFLGVVDFEKQQLSFDASLYESYVLFMTLTGDMAVRVYWGHDPNFLLSVGGFHPSYRPPPAIALGDLARLAILISQPQPLIRAEVYFAVTANTVQFGAKVELMAGARIFNVYGFLALDALIQFDPFQFVVTIAGMLAVRSGSSVLFAVRLELTLSGPSPWHAKGKASFEIGFILTITITVRFDITVGQDRKKALPPIAVIEILIPALNQDAAWQALPPTEHSPQVSLREVPAEGPLVLHPAGALAIAQKVVPLNLPLTRVGARRVDGGTTFRIETVQIGASATPAPVTPVREQFAPAQFTELSDAEKLSRPSFESLEAGVQVRGGDAPRADFMRVVKLTYEVIYVRKPRQRLFFVLAQALADVLVMAGAAARSSLGRSQFKPSQVATPPVAVEVPGYAVASTESMGLHGADLVFPSYAEAAAARAQLVAGDPKLTGKLQVLSSYELAA